MKYKYDHDFHIHSQLSLCSDDPHQTNDDILRYAEENGLRTIVLTNHYWDSAMGSANHFYTVQNFEHLAKAKPLPQGRDCTFLFGCEGEMKYDETLGVPPFRYPDFDFIILPTTHLHMPGFTITEENASSFEGLRRMWVSRFERVLASDLPAGKTGIAHLSNRLCAGGCEKRPEMLSGLREDVMLSLFERAEKKGYGIELNARDFIGSPEEDAAAFRIFRIAKKAGCKFYLGSDSHHPAHFVGVREVFEKIIDGLCLTEDDKFKIKR